MQKGNRTKPLRFADRLVNIFEAAMFGSRWLLLPINLGLCAALVMYVVKFVLEDIDLLRHALGYKPEQLMVGVLGLIDIAMVANLLVMIIQGSHQIFIRRIEISDPRSRPQWLDHIDSGILKVKVSMSIAGITLIQILKDFVNIESIGWDAVLMRILIHLVALASAYWMARIWRVTFQEHHVEHETPSSSSH